MNQAEMFRAELRNGTPEAIKRVKWVAETTADPRVRLDALEYLSTHNQRS